jgi:hypothetical protein
MSFRREKEERIKRFIISVLEEAKGDYRKIDEIIRREIRGRRKLIREVETDFDNFIKNLTFGVSMPEFYTTRFKKDIDLLQHARNRIEHLIELYQRDRELFNWVVKEEFKGYVRIVKKEIEKLAKTKPKTYSLINFI